jgi:hypothetical protein
MPDASPRAASAIPKTARTNPRYCQPILVGHARRPEATDQQAVETLSKTCCFPGTCLTPPGNDYFVHHSHPDRRPSRVRSWPSSYRMWRRARVAVSSSTGLMPTTIRAAACRARAMSMATAWRTLAATVKPVRVTWSSARKYPSVMATYLVKTSIGDAPPSSGGSSR